MSKKLLWQKGETNRGGGVKAKIDSGEGNDEFGPHTSSSPASQPWNNYRTAIIYFKNAAREPYRGVLGGGGWIGSLLWVSKIYSIFYGKPPVSVGVGSVFDAVKKEVR